MSEAEKSAGSAPGDSGAIDVQKIHHLVRLMKRYDVTALEINDGSSRIRLKRGHDPVAASTPAYAPPATAYAAPVQPVAPAAPASSAPQAPAAPADTGGLVVIESPMVGTFYSSSSPDAPSFVSVGSSIQPDSVVCIIEAMKVFTDIPAGVSGTIAEVLVKSGQAVEFGQALFRVRPA